MFGQGFYLTDEFITLANESYLTKKTQLESLVKSALISAAVCSCSR